jgi:hypothetical protein
MRVTASLAALLIASATFSPVAASAATNPCDVPGSDECRNSPDYDPWWWDPFYPDPGTPPPPGPICQDQVGDESQPPPPQGSREAGCVLP